MKRKRDASAAAGKLKSTAKPKTADTDDAPGEVLALSVAAAGGDVCAALIARYGRSSAPQHRHLLASAAALRALLSDEGLPLTPSAYLAAAVTALRSASLECDAESCSAVAALLAIVLPLVSVDELTQSKVKDASSIAAAVLEKCRGDWLPTGTVRSLLKSLGHLALHIDLEDWEAVEAPLRIMLNFAVDRRPKVRRCAQECAEKLLGKLRETSIAMKASGVMVGILSDHIPSAMQFAHATSTEKFQQADASEFVYLLNLITLVVPSLSKKDCKEVFMEACQLLRAQFSPFTRQILNLLTELVMHATEKFINLKSDIIFGTLVAYISNDDDKNPSDTIVSALKLLDVCLKKLSACQPSLWIKALPSIFAGASGFLLSESSSGDVANALMMFIKDHVDKNVLLEETTQNEVNEIDGVNALRSVCSSLSSLLSSTKHPSEAILRVISLLFLKLGPHSYVCTKDILLQLSYLATTLEGETPELKKVHECIGAAVIAIGPEKVLSIIPIALNVDKSSCSNSWLIPILDEYIVGAPLEYFIHQIVPLANSLKVAATSQVNKVLRRGLKSCASSLWKLLPAFCRYPVDIGKNFGSLCELLIGVLKGEPSLQITVANALQGLIEKTKMLVDGSGIDLPVPQALVLEVHYADCVSVECYSKESAVQNIKALALYSTGLLSTLTDIFVEMPAKKRTCIKDSLRCVASISESAGIRRLFLSLLAKYNLQNSLEGPGKPENQIQDVHANGEAAKSSTEKLDEKRCLLLQLISNFAEAANGDHLNLFFAFIQSCLLNGGKSCHADALFALSHIVKEQGCFCLSRLDNILVLLQKIKVPHGAAVLKGQLSCYQYLLVHMLKAEEEDLDKKAFLILNDLILTLKSKKETRKFAYDALLTTSSILKNSSSDEVHLQRLLTMVMGYLSSTSTHIMSGAIAAISLLMHNDASFCLSVPNLVPSVLALLRSKATEVVKAGLGFVKVLVSSLQTEVLMKLQADIINAIVPWSAVSKFHFRAKVSFILEILIRKSGFEAVETMVPRKYKAFVKGVAEARKTNKHGKGASDSKESTEKEPKRRKTDSNKDGTPRENPKFEKKIDSTKRPRSHAESGKPFLKKKHSSRPQRQAHNPGKRKHGLDVGNQTQPHGSTKKRKVRNGMPKEQSMKT